MNVNLSVLLGFLSMGGLLFPFRLMASVQFDAEIPQVAFAAQELADALNEKGLDQLQITITVKPDTSSPEAFTVQTVSTNGILISGSDASGAMYGGLEVADEIRLGRPVENAERSPFVKKRGIKFNIPWDARTPSYDDTGDNAQKNIETIWDFEGFWKPYLDDLARYRYNVLSLWSTHPYPSIIKLDDYPEVALDDVYRIGVDLKPEYKNKLQDLDQNDDGCITLEHDANVLKRVKKITIDEKIEHWRRVFEYAGDRGIEIYLFHWNVFTFGATGKHGITEDQTNDITIDYLRKSVRQTLLTYPQIAGIGVTAGENADNQIKGKYSIESFLFNTYGRGIMDVKELQPDRKVRFIFRRHMTGLGPITEAFSEFTDDFDTSFKYAIGHMYGMRKPKLFDIQFRREVEEFKIPCWLNLRNDDLFVFRWGSPDYVSEYVREMPHDVMAGFYMGSDGYVWARETIAKNPEMAGRLEIDKHWYRFRQWGQIAYNPELDRDYWEAVLEQRFPGVDGKLLYDAWASVSEVVPQVNAFCFKPNDSMVAPEGCIAREGFMNVDAYFLDKEWGKSMPGSGILSAGEWGKAVSAGETPEGITPLQVADNLEGYAATALELLPVLRKQEGGNVELQETINDIESIAWLGHYYANKIRGAAKLAAFREDIDQKQFNVEAVAHFEEAAAAWKAYAAIASAQYNPQLMARTHYMDWNAIQKGVEQEVVDAAREGDYPDIRFVNLMDGAQLSASDELKVDVAATDGDGLKAVKLYLNGLLLTGEKSNESYVWNGSTDELLKTLKPGLFNLRAVAEDKTGTFGRQEIQIIAGNVSGGRATAWKDEIHQVILMEGERLMFDDKRVFSRLECDLKLNEEGRLVLHGVTPGGIGEWVLLWKAVMHRDRTGGPYYSCLDNGRLTTWRCTPGHPEIKIFETPEVSGNGPFKLGITVSKDLVIFSDAESEERTIVWKSSN